MCDEFFSVRDLIMRPNVRFNVRVILACLAALIANASVAIAHDIGAMLIAVKVGHPESADHALGQPLMYFGTVRVDLSHLPPASSIAIRSGIDTPERREAVEVLRAKLGQSSELRFDDQSQPIRFEGGTFTSDGLLEFVFSGPIPAATRTLAWSSTAPPGQYLWRATASGESDAQAQWLKPGEISDALELQSAATAGRQSLADTIVMYLKLGFTHILPDGVDHILFVLGLLILSPRLKPVLWQATAFTLAHTITLGLAASGLVRAPSSWVEPLIAASIAFIGIENILMRKFSTRRLGVSFGFGLLHGLGFASALQEIGLPQGRFGVALVSFNVGVEAGQLTVILAAFLAVGIWTRDKAWYRPRIAIPASLAISCVALFWTVQRVVG
jgi:hypothetical protein